MILPITRLLRLTVILAVCVVTVPLSAETFNLTPQDNWFEILSGPAFLQPGDEIVFSAGTYSDSRRLSIGYRGTAANPVIIRAADGANVIFTRPNASQNVINLEGAQHLTIKGLEITGGGAGIRMGNKGAIPSKFITLDGNLIHHVDGAAVTANFNGQNSQGMHFLNNEIHHTGAEGEGFYLGCNNNACQFYDGIIEKNYIHDLIDPGNGVYQGDGIELKDGSYNNIIRDNVIHNTNFPGIIVYGVEEQGARNIIERNVIWETEQNAGVHGIQVAADAIVRNNIIINPANNGIHVQVHQGAVPGNLDIVNNTIILSSEDVGDFSHNNALEIAMPPGATYSGPILIANNALYPADHATNTVNTRAIRHNDVLQGAGITFINNIGRKTALPGLTTSEFDPSGDLATDFEDFLNLNVFPKIGSALIGAGDASLQPSDDFNLTSRSGSNDVGAYRFDANGNPGWVVGPDFKQFFSSPGTPGDFDTDGDVDGVDFLLWQRNPGVGNLSDWQNNYGAGGAQAVATSVPEPSALLLLAIGSSALFSNRSRVSICREPLGIR